MVMEDGCDTALSLGLSLPANRQQRQQKPLPPPPPQPEPSLTLSLSEETCAKETRLSSSHSTVSSFSTSNIKKERAVEVGEVGEVQRSSSLRTREEQEEEEEEEAAAGARKKLRLTKDQSALLEDRFKEHTTLSPKQKQALSKQLNLRPRQIEVWFQNRRARTKLKQTEVDCDMLRRCCETLTEENRRLQRELQDLKALKFSAAPRPPPFFVQLPAATLTICPSCDRITGAGNGKASSEDAVHAGGGMPTQHFFNPFAHSATC